MHPRVKCGAEVCVSTWCNPHYHPPYERYCCVVIDVQKTDLVNISFHQHDEGINKLIDFAYEKYIYEFRKVHFARVVCVTPEIVAIFIRLRCASKAHVSTEYDEKDVVEYHERLEPCFNVICLRFSAKPDTTDAHNQQINE